MKIDESESTVEIVIDVNFESFISKALESDIVNEYTRYSNHHYCLMLAHDDFIFSVDVFPSDGIQESDYSLEDFVSTEQDQDVTEKTGIIIHPKETEMARKCRSWLLENVDNFIQ